MEGLPFYQRFSFIKVTKTFFMFERVYLLFFKGYAIYKQHKIQFDKYLSHFNFK